MTEIGLCLDQAHIKIHQIFVDLGNRIMIVDLQKKFSIKSGITFNLHFQGIEYLLQFVAKGFIFNKNLTEIRRQVHNYVGFYLTRRSGTISS